MDLNYMEKKKGLHVGIIPDGSRRWFLKNFEKGAGRPGDVADSITRHIFDNYPEISEITLWALSTENFKRKEKDKSAVYSILEKKIADFIDYISKSGKDVKINVIGSRWKEVPQSISKVVTEAVETTKNNKRLTLNICIGYGGKDEILDAAMGASRWLRKNPAIARIHEGVFEKFLMIPRSLDLMIRTGGERRLSGFMLYQIEYAELFFSDILWPDFTTKDFDDIMEKFRERERRYGR